MPYAHLLKDYIYRVEAPREPIPLAYTMYIFNEPTDFFNSGIDSTVDYFMTGNNMFQYPEPVDSHWQGGFFDGARWFINCGDNTHPMVATYLKGALSYGNLDNLALQYP
mmetsp:Transcript_8826/g.25672  ORF Transcript_8826/g.25672 Transcript_8826/m.25672 type:complete len:109 (+) Transcript_8826:84-410(+)